MKKKLFTIPEKESLELKYKLHFLRLGIVKFPDHLRGNYGFHARKSDWFDSNKYLEVFDKIQIMDGYTLDYFYHMGKLGGRPILFTRKIGKKYYPNNNEMGKLMKKLSHKSSLINHIGFEKSPTGYFQFAVFNIVVHKFYLFWHSNYARSNFVFSKNELKNKINKIRGDGYLTNIFIAENIKINPQVEILNERDAKVILTIFSIWHGIFYYTTTIEYPNKILNTNKVTVIPYDMGLRF